MTRNYREHEELEEQTVPEESHCPECGASPTEDSVVQHRLAAVGYLHDDVKLQCSECEASWLLGIPIGEGGYDDLWCPSCDDSYAFVHRVEHLADRDTEKYRLHLKCPNCFTFRKVTREPDENGLALVGYPCLTGKSDSRTKNDGYADGTLNRDGE